MQKNKMEQLQILFGEKQGKVKFTKLAMKKYFDLKVLE